MVSAGRRKQESAEKEECKASVRWVREIWTGFEDVPFDEKEVSRNKSNFCFALSGVWLQQANVSMHLKKGEGPVSRG